MPSRPAAKISAQKKVVTYGASSRDRMGNKAQPTNSTHAASDLYDFPDSDDSGSSPRHSNIVSTTKPIPHTHANPKSVTPSRSSATRRVDDGRKRKHGKAFDADIVSKQPATIGNHLTSPSTKPRVAKYDDRSRPETASLDFSASQAHSSQVQPRPPRQLEASSPICTPIRTVPRPWNSRLIDRLAAQKPESSGSSSDSGSDSDASTREDEKNRTPVPHSQASPTQRSDLHEREVWSRPTYSQVGASASKKVKHTYSQTRSIRDDTQSQHDPFGFSNNLQDDPLMSNPPTKTEFADEFDMNDDDDDDPSIAIKSVHELRRAGANHRFADEMEDLLSRIGTPIRSASSMRRNGLLELAQKLQRGDFATQFRDHSSRDNISKNIGVEGDVISGFAITASLVIFLSSHNAPHLLRRLVEERVGKLLGRLLHISEDVDIIAGQRTSNLAKSSRATISSIKCSLVRMPIWHGYELTTFSPRSLALQLCHILQRNLETRYRNDLCKDMQEDFTGIVETQVQQGSTDDVDFALVVLVMESESEADVTALARDQIGRRASNAARIFQWALDKWPGNREELGTATLKLAINTTNTEIGAEAFGDEALLANLARCISVGLRQAQKAVDNRNLEASMYDGLLLILGIMINILEHFPPARAALDAHLLEPLAGLFLANRKSAGDVSCNTTS